METTSQILKNHKYGLYGERLETSLSASFFSVKMRLTGPRRILLVGSAPALTQWLTQEHPTSDNRDSFLFCNTARGKEGTQLSYASVKKILNNNLLTYSLYGANRGFKSI